MTTQKGRKLAECAWKSIVIVILIVLLVSAHLKLENLAEEIRYTQLALSNVDREISYVAEKMKTPIDNSEFKSYMDYRTINSKSTTQYLLQKDAITDEKGFRRLNGMYMVALGSRYGEVGDVFAITLEGDVMFLAIKGDEKQDIHTINGNGIQAHDGSVVEFIVDTDSLSDTVKLMGDCSYAGFYGNILQIERVDI